MSNGDSGALLGAFGDDSSPRTLRVSDGAIAGEIPVLDDGSSFLIRRF
jgi:hypothetical protein